MNIVDVNSTTLQKIIKNTPVKLGVLVIAAIPTMMIISMHGNVLALATTKPILSIGDPGYQLKSRFHLIHLVLQHCVYL
jgi:hypothetical protein